jgi:Na+/H+-dicarboxylate symporter
LYCSFATLFIAQVYGIELGFGQQALLLAVLMLTSKGIAGVPRASLVVVAATLPQFHLPQAGVLLLLGADHFLDMGRTGINVVGNSIAAALVSKWEGELTAGQQSTNLEASADPARS